MRNKKLLFIGDSITDAHRNNDPDGLGDEYVRLIHDYIHTVITKPKIDIINKGVSADRITDLDARWEQDVIAEQPDWVSVKIGLNDVWRQLDNPDMEQVYPQHFEQVYKIAAAGGIQNKCQADSGGTDDCR